jgi:hypothetical protein
MNMNSRRLGFASLIFLSGCGLFGKKPDQTAVRPVSRDPAPTTPDARPKTLAIASGNTGKDTPLGDPLPPPPPDLIIADMPSATPKDTALAVKPAPMSPAVAEAIVAPPGVAPLIREPDTLVQAGATTPVQPPRPAPAAAETPFQSMKRLQLLAAEKMAKLEGFEARLTRREVIADKPAPEQTMQFKYRTRPMSMHMKWVGTEAKGRELVYVSGRKEDTVEILTAKGDGLPITPAGKRISFAATDATIRGKTRYDLREGGMQLAVTRLGQSLVKAEQDPVTAARFRYLGRVPRPERPSGLEAIEETILAGAEPLFPKGGKRTTFFDPDPASPGHGLPILVMALNESGREVEYYFFDQLKPARFTEADFDTNILWKK